MKTESRKIAAGFDFYRLMEKVMPDWEKRKHKLELTLV